MLKPKVKPKCPRCKVDPKQAYWSTAKRLKELKPVLDTTKL